MLYVVPQVMYEIWAAATRSIVAGGLGLGPGETSTWLAKFEGQFELLQDRAAVYRTFFELMSHYEVRGVNSHDGRLVAAMVVHDLTHLLTFNQKDFRRYDEISLIDPTVRKNES